MKNTFPLLLIVLFSNLFGQTKVYTSIQENTKKYPGKNFSITKVIDARANRDHLGIVRKTDLAEEYLADFNVPLPVEFINFFDRTYPAPTSPAKINLVVNTFDIGHKVTGKRNDTGFVKVDFDYYTVIHDTAFFLYNYKHTLIDVHDNIALTHSNRMKRVVLMSAAKLDSLALDEKTKQAMPGFIHDISYSYSKTQSHAQDSTNKTQDYPEIRMTIIMGHVILGSVANMYGANFSILGRFKNHKRLLMGFNANYSVIAFKDVTIPPNTEYKMFTTDFGIKLLRQIKHAVFFNSNAHLMLGKETYTSLKTRSITVSNGVYTQPVYQQEETTHFLTGVQLDNGILFTHPQKQGLAAGIDLVLRFTNSSVFDSDVGIKFSLGVAF